MKKTTIAFIFTSALFLSSAASACLVEFGLSGEHCIVTCASGAGTAAAIALSGQPELTPLAMLGCLGSGNPNS